MQATLRSRSVRRTLRATIAIGILVGLYALAGFVAVPRLLRPRLTRYVAQQYHHPLALGEIHFNPFTLRLDVEHIALAGASAQPILGARRLQVELSLASLWHRAPTFKSIVLDQPFVRAVVRHNGQFNLSALAPSSLHHSPAVHRPKPFELYIDHLSVVAGRVIYENRAHRSTFHTELKRIDFDLKDFRTVGTAPDRYTLAFATSHGGRFHGRGTLAVEPFVSHGRFSLSGLPLRTIWRYLRDRLHFAITAGELALKGSYTFAPTGRTAQKHLDFQSIEVRRLAVRPLMAKADVVTLGTLAADSAHVDLRHRTLSLGSLTLDGGTLHVSLEADGRVNLVRLLNGVVGTSHRVQRAKPTAPWSISVATVTLHDVKLIAADREVTPAAAVTLSHMALDVHDLRLPSQTPAKFTVHADVDRKGKLGLSGSYNLRSGAAHVRLALAHVGLTPLQPFLAQESALALSSGLLSTQLDIRRTSHHVLNVTGNTDVRSLRVVDDLLGRNFVKWRSLAVQGLRFRSKPASLAIRRIVTIAPYARVIVTPQRKLNILQDFTAAHRLQADEQSPNESSNAGTKRSPDSAALSAQRTVHKKHSMSISVGRVDVVDGSAHYTDLWIVPHFFLAIQKLDGDVTGLSSNANSRATVNLKGKVDRYAPISVSGTLNLFSASRYTNMKMIFHGVQLTMATPYSAHFAGYKIEKGTMSANITYHLDHGLLSADPHFIIDQLELGQRVNSPQAIHLPLKFAIALLKNREGVIDLNLPISGRLSDPEFKLGPLIVKVLLNILTKAVTSPFALLGKLVGGGPHLQDVDFQPGSAALSTQARQRLAKLAHALEERPALKVNVPSDYAPTLDLDALARAKLQRRLRELRRVAPPRIARHGASRSTSNGTSPTARFRLLLELYRAQFGARKPLPPAAGALIEARGHKKAATALAPAIAALKAALLAHIHIPSRALARLARRRAIAIQGALLTGTHIDPGRLFVLNTGTVKPHHGTVRIALALN